jgi:hypothetical protein
MACGVKRNPPISPEEQGLVFSQAGRTELDAMANHFPMVFVEGENPSHVACTAHLVEQDTFIRLKRGFPNLLDGSICPEAKLVQEPGWR